MLVFVSDAKGQLTELVRRAEAGDEVVLTRHGKVVARLVPMSQRPTHQDLFGFEIVPVTAATTQRISANYATWGRSRHPAGLNSATVFPAI